MLLKTILKAPTKIYHLEVPFGSPFFLVNNFVLFIKKKKIPFWNAEEIKRRKMGSLTLSPMFVTPTSRGWTSPIEKANLTIKEWEQHLLHKIKKQMVYLEDRHERDKKIAWTESIFCAILPHFWTTLCFVTYPSSKDHIPFSHPIILVTIYISWAQMYNILKQYKNHI